ncbi:uncharacterized protein A4U43_C07F11810 [Asparagus officinalis]|uniref:J domain-containing protein n=1 Tax=Asparagus officinalis TaxID=4686 RepID=A0A5P1EE94_ASPOF|nr:uncharacterized protein LOC109850645 [Asparagus officinalis]ONK63139.1 uncharacterized protein A4U43_C07F11810 [Asparagus officinalis]
MQVAEARKLLGFSPHSRPSLSQIKAAYRKKVLESHPDRFPCHEKAQAESRFKQISEAYSSLQAGVKFGRPSEGTYVRVVRTGVPGSYRSSNKSLIKAPFLLLMLGTISFGGLNASRAYQRQKQANPSDNPFLP